MIRIGQGVDFHIFSSNRDLILGGIRIPYEFGLLGHSDADVLVHSIMDAMLGALALGDIGKHFPDTDTKFKGADSLKLLTQVNQLIHSHHYKINNLDTTIIAQKPKILPFISKMQKKIANTLQIDPRQISIKATTTEKMGAIGRKEGIAALSIVLLETQLNGE